MALGRLSVVLKARKKKLKNLKYPMRQYLVDFLNNDRFICNYC